MKQTYVSFEMKKCLSL